MLFQFILLAHCYGFTLIPSLPIWHTLTTHSRVYACLDQDVHVPMQQDWLLNITGGKHTFGHIWEKLCFQRRKGGTVPSCSLELPMTFALSLLDALIDRDNRIWSFSTDMPLSWVKSYDSITNHVRTKRYHGGQCTEKRRKQILVILRWWFS